MKLSKLEAIVQSLKKKFNNIVSPESTKLMKPGWLIEELNKTGHRDSALLVKNWNELDENAEAVLEKYDKKAAWAMTQQLLAEHGSKFHAKSLKRQQMVDQAKRGELSDADKIKQTQPNEWKTTEEPDFNVSPPARKGMVENEVATVHHGRESKSHSYVKNPEAPEADWEYGKRKSERDKLHHYVWQNNKWSPHEPSATQETLLRESHEKRAKAKEVKNPGTAGQVDRKKWGGGQVDRKKWGGGQDQS